jgi:regulator of sigma E protease
MLLIIGIIIVIFSLLFLVVIHELGHFILARKFGVKVEEFGIGIPPKIVGKKIGETVYSINLLPIGAFVKLYGEEEKIEDSRSFSQKPIWQRVLIVLGGVISFWIISVIIISIIAFVWGIPTQLNDIESLGLRDRDPRVLILGIANDKDSPAYKAELEIGDIIRKIKGPDSEITTDKTSEIIDFIEKNKGKGITLTIQRGKIFSDVFLTPRTDPPKGEGPIGIEPARFVSRLYPFYQAPIQGFLITKNITILIVSSFSEIIRMLFQKIPIPEGMVEVKGIFGIGQMGVQILESGVDNFLFFLAKISVFLALFNILPIPALDGGKILFLTIEKVRGKPVSQKTEQNVTMFFFILIIILAILITIKDIRTFF